jgi:hypothetical protein
MQPQDAPQAGSDGQAVSWTASEFIVHQKNAGWYMLLVAAAVVLAAVIYLLTRDVVSTGMVGVVLVVLLLLASRQPRTLSYRLDGYGVHVGSKSYPYDSFKSFSVVDEGALNSITLLPLKRFMPPISMYYDPQDEAKISQVLSDYLPFVEGHKDVVDQFMRRIRF